MSRARHGLYMVITRAMLDANVAYTLPPYQGMSHRGPELAQLQQQLSAPAAEAGAAAQQPPRPAGEGQAFMPAFLQKGALHL